jgi:hypothetical protein
MFTLKMVTRVIETLAMKSADDPDQKEGENWEIEMAWWQLENGIFWYRKKFEKKLDALV